MNRPQAYPGTENQLTASRLQTQQLTLKRFIDEQLIAQETQDLEENLQSELATSSASTPLLQQQSDATIQTPTQLKKRADLLKGLIKEHPIALSKKINEVGMEKIKELLTQFLVSEHLSKETTKTLSNFCYFFSQEDDSYRIMTLLHSKNASTVASMLDILCAIAKQVLAQYPELFEQFTGKELLANMCCQYGNILNILQHRYHDEKSEDTVQLLCKVTTKAINQTSPYPLTELDRHFSLNHQAIRSIVDNVSSQTHDNPPQLHEAMLALASTPQQLYSKPVTSIRQIAEAAYDRIQTEATQAPSCN